MLLRRRVPNVVAVETLVRPTERLLADVGPDGAPPPKEPDRRVLPPVPHPPRPDGSFWMECPRTRVQLLVARPETTVGQPVVRPPQGDVPEQVVQP